jgi:hypothetical protein
MVAIIKAAGLDRKIADQLRKDLIPQIQDNNPRDKPFYQRNPTETSERVLKQYVEVYCILDSPKIEHED